MSARFSLARRMRGAIGLSIAAMALAAAPSVAQDQIAPRAPAAGVTDGAVDETPGSWFVELQAKPTTDGGSLSTINAQEQAFEDQATAEGIDYDVNYTYKRLFNGYSVDAGEADVAGLSGISVVKAVYPVMPMSAEPIDNGSGTEDTNQNALIGADLAHTAGWTGS